MFKDKVYLYGVTAAGGFFTAQTYFLDSTKALYVQPDDVVTNDGNKFRVVTWAGYPSAVSDGTDITYEPVVSSDIMVEDSDYDSELNTPGAYDVRSQLTVIGSIANIVWDTSSYSWFADAVWDDPTVANDAIAGDFISDYSGRVFELAFLDPTDKWSVSCRIKEISSERYGIAPLEGPANLFRPTVGEGLFTGTVINDTMQTAMWARDNWIIEKFIGPEVVPPSSGSSTLGLPTDGTYGGTNGNISGVAQGDTHEDAIDKIETILGKLAPAKPANLSAKTLAISSTYQAYESSLGTPTLRNTVIDDTIPLAQTPAGASNAFFNGEEGTLTAEIDGVVDGSKVLTTSDDSGTYTSLKILSDADFYVGQAGKEGFWKALIAGIKAATPLSLGQHTYQMKHSTTGNTPVLTFSVDDPGTVTISATTVVGSGTGRFISGVPSLATNDLLTAAFTVNNAIRKHYNSTRIARADSIYAVTGINQSLPGTPPASGATYPASIALSVATSKYTENANITATGYNSKGGTGTANIVNNIRIDTVSNETSRKKSGQGQYPTKGSTAAQFGDTFVSTVSLATTGNEELQLLNGIYQYPSGNYTANTPVAGPDYTSVPSGSFTNYRWVTFNLGPKTAVSSVNLTLVGGVNLGATTLISGLLLYVLVDGSTPTNGWVDANAAYPGVGNPTNNGDPALVIGSSTTTVKQITFGTNVKTGDVWVRVGIPSGSNKKFSSITIA